MPCTMRGVPLTTLCLTAVLSLGLAGVKNHRDEPASYHQQRRAAEKSGDAAAQRVRLDAS